MTAFLAIRTHRLARYPREAYRWVHDFIVGTASLLLAVFAMLLYVTLWIVGIGLAILVILGVFGLLLFGVRQL